MNKQQLKQLEADLWAAADTLRANSDLKAKNRWLGGCIAPILELIKELAESNHNLLLPRLISGKRSVEHLHIQFSPSM